MVRPVSSIFGKILTGSLVSSAMFTESSKPTIAKKASEVAAVTAMKAFLSVCGVERDHAGEVDVAAAGERPQPDQDHQQQAGDLDDRQDHVELDALAHPAQVDQRQQRS